MTHRIPSLNWLRVFEAAARTGSFARAAELMNMSPPAVSQQIRALEGALGRELFERGSRSVRLTDAGKTYLPTVARTLHALDSATANLFGGPENATLTVRCSLLFAVGWLTPRLPDFSRRHPEIRLSLLTGVHDLEFDASASELRIVFGMPPRPYEEADMLFGETVYPVARPDIAETLNDPADLLAHPLVEIATHRVNWWSYLPSEGPAPRFVFTDNSVTALAMARDGAIGLARAPASGDLPALYGLVRCECFAPIAGVQGYTLVHPGADRLGQSATRFRDWLLGQAAETPSPP